MTIPEHIVDMAHTAAIEEMQRREDVKRNPLTQEQVENFIRSFANHVTEDPAHDYFQFRDGAQELSRRIQTACVHPREKVYSELRYCDICSAYLGLVTNG